MVSLQTYETDLEAQTLLCYTMASMYFMWFQGTVPHSGLIFHKRELQLPNCASKDKCTVSSGHSFTEVITGYIAITWFSVLHLINYFIQTWLVRQNLREISKSH